MKTIEQLTYFIREAEAINDEWRDDAAEWYKIYRGEQWDENDKTTLENQNRPALVFNRIRPIIRLLSGMERKTRYDMKVLPVGEGGDHDIARLFTGFIKQIELDNRASYVYTDAYHGGLITGRGWINVDINYDRNRFGDIIITSIDPYEMIVDPYAQKQDYSDGRYLIRELYLTEDEVKVMYPQFRTRGKLEKLESALPEYGDPISQERPTYRIYEIWYKEYTNHWYIIDNRNGDVIRVEREDAKKLADNPNITAEQYLRPEVYYAVISGGAILEQEPSPYLHNEFPYVPFFCEFTPRFGEEKPQWHSIITDLVDPQREKNKKHSMWVDILMRFINKGYRYVKGSIENEEELDYAGAAPGFKIIHKTPEGFANFQVMEGSAPHPALLQVGALYDNEINTIGSVPPSLQGYEESSRESGRVVMLRQQQGYAMLAPYQDNMRLTRYLVTKQILALIPQVYTANRMVRMVSDTGDVQTVMLERDMVRKLQSIYKIQNDVTIDRYDIVIGESPSTPTSRQAEFMELMEMVQAGVLPITPNIVKLLIKSSDVSLKNEILDILEQEMQQAQAQRQQQQVLDSITK